ncbi:MAG: hypothetical protein QXX99_07360 [Candidatus Bathyarchaeia archaeon]
MYDELFDAWKKERESPELQPLPKDFYTRLAEYVRRIREEMRMMDEESLRGRIIRVEEENVRRMVSDLIQTRHRKILELIEKEGAIPLSSLTEEEESLYGGLMESKKALNNLLNDIMLGQKPRVKQFRSSGLSLVRILRELPQIIGVDMKVYGPFKPEDIATLPEENARALIRQGAVVEIDVE